MTVFVAILMGIPAALLVSLILGLAVGGGEVGGTLTLWAMLIGFVVLGFLFARGAVRPRSSLRRGLITVSLESFFLPLVAIVFAVVVGGGTIGAQTGQAAMAGAAVGSGLAGAVLIAVGFVLAIAIGVPCLILYLVLKPSEPGASPQPPTAS